MSLPLSFDEAIRFLEAAINYEKIVTFKYDAPSFNLLRVENLLLAVGSPHRILNCVHVAGTKGKGTTSALLSNILTASGRRTGLFTSPHLLDVTERIMIDGRPMPSQAFAERIQELRQTVAWLRLTDMYNSPTYFEMLTAIGLRHFQLEQVDCAVIEVGLGGRLDSTNVIRPRVAVVTSIGWDHMDKLGNRIIEIAHEKAGIIKPGCTTIIGPQRYRKAETALARRAEVLADHVLCHGRHFAACDLHPTPTGWHFSLDIEHPVLGRRTLPDLDLALLGRHQVGNAAAAAVAGLVLGELEGRPVSEEALRAGLAGIRWPGRIDLVPGEPPLVVDAAHTVESVQALIQALRTHLPGRPRHYVFACSYDKNPAALLRYLMADGAGIVLTRYDMPRSADPEVLRRIARRVGSAPVAVTGDAVSAFDLAVARARPGDVLCFTGSFFLAAELYRLLADRGLRKQPLAST